MTFDPTKPVPIDMRLPCPECGVLHIDEGEFLTKAHHTHACQHCGMVWRPAIEPTRGVQFLPGFLNSLPEMVDTAVNAVKAHNVPEKRVFYVNVYPEQRNNISHPSRDQADKYASPRRTACIRVEYEEGRFDD